MHPGRLPTLVGMISPTHSDIKLSPNFWLSEFELSTTAVRLGLRNEADGAQISNLKRVAGCGEQIRSLLGNVPILISSGLRTLIVNGVVKGLIAPDQIAQLGTRPELMARLRADTSAHKDGRAMDFTAPGFGSPREVVQRLMDSGLAFDQLIYEGRWVHFGLAKVGEEPRKQVMTAVFEPGRAVRYVRGLV